MKALRYTQKGGIEITEMAEPVPGPGEVIVKVEACGICHTDIDVLHGRYGNGTFPLIPGHEFAGRIEALGPGVEGLEIGTAVVADPNLPCLQCRPCRRGLFNLCGELGAYGVTVDGGFAEMVRVRAGNLVVIGAMPFHRAALAEPLACVLNGVDKAGTQGVERALVFGAGPIGLLMGLTLQARGVDEVVMVDIEEERLEFAQGVGLDTMTPGTSEAFAQRRSFDLAVDATGRAPVGEALIDWLEDGGTALLFGVCPPDARMRIPPFEIFRRQLTLCGAHSLNRNIAAALAVLDEKGDLMERLVSHRLPLEALPERLDGRHAGEAMKVQFAAG